MTYSVARKRGWYVLTVETPTHRRKRWYIRLSKAVEVGERFVRRYARSLAVAA